MKSDILEYEFDKARWLKHNKEHMHKDKNKPMGKTYRIVAVLMLVLICVGLIGFIGSFVFATDRWGSKWL